MMADENVFEDCHLREQANVLECPGNAQGRNLVRFLPFDRFTFKENIPCRDLVDTGN